MIKKLSIFILVLLFGACSQHSQPIQNIEGKNGSIILDTSYMLYVIDKNEKKYKFKLNKGEKLQIDNGIQTYVHHALGKVKVIKKEKSSKNVIGGGWDYSDAISY